MFWSQRSVDIIPWYLLTEFHNRMQDMTYSLVIFPIIDDAGKNTNSFKHLSQAMK